MKGLLWILVVIAGNAILAAIAKRLKAKAEADALLKSTLSSTPQRPTMSPPKGVKQAKYPPPIGKGALSQPSRAQSQVPRVAPQPPRVPTVVPVPTSATGEKAYSVGTAAEAMSDHKSAHRAHTAADLARLRRKAHSREAMRQFLAMSEVLGPPRAVAPWHPVG